MSPERLSIWLGSLVLIDSPPPGTTAGRYSHLPTHRQTQLVLYTWCLLLQCKKPQKIRVILTSTYTFWSQFTQKCIYLYTWPRPQIHGRIILDHLRWYSHVFNNKLHNDDIFSKSEHYIQKAVLLLTHRSTIIPHFDFHSESSSNCRHVPRIYTVSQKTRHLTLAHNYAVP